VLYDGLFLFLSVDIIEAEQRIVFNRIYASLLFRRFQQNIHFSQVEN
jgi:hypothetical protein